MNYKHWATCLRVATVVLISGHSILLKAQPAPTHTPSAAPLAVKIDLKRMALFVAKQMKKIFILGGPGTRVNQKYIKTLTTGFESLYRQTCASAEPDIGRLSYFPFNQASIDASNQYRLTLVENQVKCSRVIAWFLSRHGLLGMPMAVYYMKNNFADAQLIEKEKKEQIPSIPEGLPNNSPTSNKVGEFIPVKPINCKKDVEQAVCGQCKPIFITSDPQSFPCTAASSEPPNKMNMKGTEYWYIPRQVYREKNNQSCEPFLVYQEEFEYEFAKACELKCPPPLWDKYKASSVTTVRAPYAGGVKTNHAKSWRLTSLPKDGPDLSDVPSGQIRVWEEFSIVKTTINESHFSTCDKKFSYTSVPYPHNQWITLP